MRPAAKLYISGVVAAGVVVFAASLASWSSPRPLYWLLYLMLTASSSLLKLRLPGMSGTYSLNFLFLLYGMARFTLAETLVAGCAGAVVQTLWNSRKKPQPVQILFNMANLVVSVALCFLAVRALETTDFYQYRPAVLALVAFVYFAVNTVLVSGVLALLQGKRLLEVCREWYLWSFPHYLLGAALVGLITVPGGSLHGEAWLVLLPLVYLLHFFLGLLAWRPQAEVSSAETGRVQLPHAAQLYVFAVLAAGAVLLVAAASHWRSENPTRFAWYLGLVVAASTLKVRLPRMTSTISVNFVLLLVAIAELSLPEAVFMAAVAGVVQRVWKPRRRPELLQVLFNPACLALSTGLAYVVCRWGMDRGLSQSLVGLLVAATLVLYGSNTLLVAIVLCLAERKPLGSVWQSCYFWSCPYYLVGAAAAGLMIAASRSAGWQPSVLVLPVMALVYVSYRAHVSQAAGSQTT